MRTVRSDSGWIRGAAGSALALVLGLAPASPATAEHHEGESPLEAGAWTGFYHPASTDRVDAEFLVEEVEDEPSGWRLTLRLDFEPQERFTFVADELKVRPQGIKFRFGREGHERKCSLRKNGDGELTGTCRAGDGDESRSRIVMKRPSEPEPDVASAPPGESLAPSGESLAPSGE